MNTRLKLSILFLFISFMLNAQNPYSSGNDDLQTLSEYCGKGILKIDLNRASTIDTTFCYRWSNAEQQWVPRTIFVNNYDDFGRLMESITKFYVDSTQSYNPILRDTYTYYPNDSVKSMLNELWNTELNGGSWDNTQLNEYEYDDQDRLVYNLVYFSPYGSLELNLGNQLFYSYNNLGLTDTIITQYWNTIQNEWYYSYRTRNYYDGEMQLSETYRDWANNQNGDYTQYEREIFITEGERIRNITQNYFEGVWSNYYSELNTMNEMGLPDSILYQQWNPMDMMWDTTVMDLALFEYNESGKLTEYITLSYYLMFVYNQRLNWFYDGEGYLTEMLSRQWDFNNEAWLNVNNCFYPPLPVVTSANGFFDDGDSFVVYPNPANDIVGFRFRITIRLPYIFPFIASRSVG